MTSPSRRAPTATATIVAAAPAAGPPDRRARRDRPAARRRRRPSPRSARRQRVRRRAGGVRRRRRRPRRGGRDAGAGVDAGAEPADRDGGRRRHVARRRVPRPARPRRPRPARPWRAAARSSSATSCASWPVTARRDASTSSAGATACRRRWPSRGCTGRRHRLPRRRPIGHAAPAAPAPAARSRCARLRRSHRAAGSRSRSRGGSPEPAGGSSSSVARRAPASRGWSTEFCRLVHRSGAAVVLGGCDDDLAVPYQPWVQAVEEVLTALPAAAMVGELASRLAPLGPLLARADVLEHDHAAAPVDPDSARYRLYEAFGRALREAATRWPTVVVLEDLHWAGAQTLALLRHVARSGLPSGVLVVGTFRDTGDEVTEPLATCLADLRRVDAVSRIRLEGLDGAAVERFAADAIGHPLDAGPPRPDDRAGDAQRRQRVLPRRALAAPRRRPAWSAARPQGWSVSPTAAVAIVPDSVREVVAARIAKLSPPARRVIEIAAVAGQRVDRGVLALALDVPSTEIDASLRRARRGGSAHGGGHDGPDVPVRARPRARHRGGLHRPARAQAWPPRRRPRHRGGARGGPPAGARRAGPALRHRRPHHPDRPGRGVRPAGGGPGRPHRGLRRSVLAPRHGARASIHPTSRGRKRSSSWPRCSCGRATTRRAARAAGPPSRWRAAPAPPTSPPRRRCSSSWPRTSRASTAPPLSCCCVARSSSSARSGRRCACASTRRSAGRWRSTAVVTSRPMSSRSPSPTRERSATPSPCCSAWRPRSHQPTIRRTILAAARELEALARGRDELWGIAYGSANQCRAQIALGDSRRRGARARPVPHRVRRRDASPCSGRWRSISRRSSPSPPATSPRPRPSPSVA